MREETFFRRNGIIKLRSLFLVFFLSEMLVYFIVSAIPYSNPAMTTQLRSEQTATYSLGLVGMIFWIFPHNLLIATIEFIPIVGQFIFVYSIIATPLALAAMSSSVGVSGMLTFLSLLLIPDTLIEVPSYAVASATSIYLLYILIKSRSSLKAKSRKILYMYLFTVLELFIAGTFESVAIQIGLTLPASESAIYVLLLWIPAAVVIYLLVRLFRYINRDEYGKSREVSPDYFQIN